MPHDFMTFQSNSTEFNDIQSKIEFAHAVTTGNSAETLQVLDFSSNTSININKSPIRGGTTVNFYCLFEKEVTIQSGEYTTQTAEAVDQYKAEGVFDPGFSIKLFDSDTFSNEIKNTDQE